MDLQLKKDGPWHRIKPDQAKHALSAPGKQHSGPQALAADELSHLLGKEDLASEA